MPEKPADNITHLVMDQNNSNIRTKAETPDFTVSVEFSFRSSSQSISKKYKAESVPTGMTHTT